MKYLSQILYAAFLTSACLLATSPICEEIDSPSPGNPAPTIHIVTTTGMIADLAKAVVGRHGTVQALMLPGVDPHLFKPTRTNLLAIHNADLVFYNGLFLEGKMTAALERAQAALGHIYPVSAHIPLHELLTPESFHSNPDPHIWMNPIFWARALDVVEAQLSDSFPRYRDDFSSNTAAYRSQLLDLDRYITNIVATIPPDSRVLITAHDAFRYFGRRYGIEVLAIQGISTESEAGVLDLENLVNTIVHRNIRSVFVESTVSERNIRALIAGAQHLNHNVQIGSELYSDAMGESDSYEGTYLGMIDHNATNIVRGLGGQTPARGWQGKLNK